MNELVNTMVQDDPSKRPTMDVVVSHFEEVRSSLGSWKLRSRVTPRSEWLIVRPWRAAPHWGRRVSYIINGTPAIPSDIRDRTTMTGRSHQESILSPHLCFGRRVIRRLRDHARSKPTPHKGRTSAREGGQETIHKSGRSSTSSLPKSAFVQKIIHRVRNYFRSKHTRHKGTTSTTEDCYDDPEKV
jgi:hypothetical protein